MASLLNALGIDRLSIDDRLQLVDEIWESLGSEIGRLPLTTTQIQELERRIAELDANPDEVIPWETVEARALKRIER